MSRFIDEKGKKHGSLKVIEYDKEKQKWLCKCDCGNTIYVRGTWLRNGSYTSCGCRIHQNNARKHEDITNQKFGLLTAIRFDKGKGWLCKCDCGNEIYTNKTVLKNGHTKSCGCTQNRRYEKFYQNDERFAKIRLIYFGMKQRCYNENNTTYKWYGGKGIRICDEWLGDYEGLINFYNWAINNGYEKGLVIDRIDSNKNYCPSNCRWVTQEQNASFISKYNKQIETSLEKTIQKKNKKRNNKLVKFFKKNLLKKIKKFITRKKKKEQQFYCRKPNYCLLHNKDYSQQYLFKSQKTVAIFLDLTPNAVGYRIRKKDGVLTDEWRLEKLNKETFNEIKSKGIEVIK